MDREQTAALIKRATTNPVKFRLERRMHDLGFKFNIGDILKQKGTLADQVRYLVVARAFEEYEGGTTRIYECSPIQPGGTPRPNMRFSEIELEPSEPFKETDVQSTEWYQGLLDAIERK